MKENKGFLKMQVPFFQVANDIFKVKIEDEEGKLVDLSIYEKMVYIYLARCANSGSAFPSYQTIADRCSMSRRKAIDCVAVLFDNNLIAKHKRKTESGDNTSNIYEVNTNLDPYISSNESKTKAKNKTSAQDALPLVNDMHHPSAQDAPYKELIINNNIINKTEDDEELSTITYQQNLSQKIKNTYQRIFNRKISPEFEQEVLSICNDKNIINYCLSVAEKQADKPKWIVDVLQDWKEKGLSTIEEIEEYQLQRKEQNKKKYSKKYNTDTEIEIDSNTIKEVKSVLKQRTGLEFSDSNIKELFRDEDDYTTIVKVIGTLNNKDLSNLVTKKKILQTLAIRVKEEDFANKFYNKGYR